MGANAMKHYLAALADTIRSNWDAPALADFRGRRLTYGQLAASMERTRLALRAAGIARGDKVALCAASSAAWAETYLALCVSGAVAVPILPNFTPEGIARLVDHSGSTVLFADRDVAAAVDMAAMPRVRAVVSVGRPPSRGAGSCSRRRIPAASARATSTTPWTTPTNSPW